jgi:hypothetical protein
MSDRDYHELARAEWLEVNERLDALERVMRSIVEEGTLSPSSIQVARNTLAYYGQLRAAVNDTPPYPEDPDWMAEEKYVTFGMVRQLLADQQRHLAEHEDEEE